MVFIVELAIKSVFRVRTRSEYIYISKIPVKIYSILKTVRIIVRVRTR